MTDDDRSTLRRFHIWIDGRLSSGFAAGLDGIDQRDTADGTILTGEYVDESHLHGLLEHLRGMAIGITRFEIDPAPRPAQTREGVS